MMYPKTPSSKQQRAAGSLIRRRRRHHHQSQSRRHEQEELSVVSSLPPPNLIAVPPEEDSPSSFSASSSPSSSSFFSSPTSRSQHPHQNHDCDDFDDDGGDDYVYDTVVIVEKNKPTSFFSVLAPLSVTSLLKKVLSLSSTSTSSSASSFSPTTSSPCPTNQHDPYQNDDSYDYDVDYVYDNVVLNTQPHFVRKIPSSAFATSLKTVLTVPLLVAILCSMLSCFFPCTKITFLALKANILFSSMRDFNQNGHPPRVVFLEPLNSARNSKRRLLDDDSLDTGVAAPEFESRECKPQYQWQLDNRVTCNRIHEVDMLTTAAVQGDSTKNKHEDDISSSPLAISHLGSGFWRDAWAFLDNDSNTKDNNDNIEQYIVLKTLRYRHAYTMANLDRHRRDAMTAEHYTKSPHIVDIYAHCGNSGMFEYGNGGDLEQVLGMNNNNGNNDDDEEQANADNDTDIPNLLDRFHIAVQAATSLATLHNFDREGVSSIAHADITLGQFISVNGTIKLNDFNRARFIAWNETSNAPCPYYIANNPGVLRSPEEYKYDPQTEKVDVYSFGNVLYVLLMLEWPFYEVDDSDAADDDGYSVFISEQVVQGRRPFIPEEIRKSANAIEKALYMAIRMCFEADPAKRVSARQVESFLISQLEAIDLQAVSKRGVAIK